jgi:sigma-B regulation protein RsbU (phosphoserine phosphatase)
MFVRDEYGVWVTGNAPVLDAQGRPVALLGVDMDAAQLLARTRNLLLTGVLAAGAGVAVAALLALITSRSLTRRLEQVTGVVERIGSGDLEARVPEDVAHASGDEISTVARAVNRVAPQLSAFLKLRQSLALAMEVQQALLPSGAPHISGLDIAGKSIYCDETGGDYYDFLDVAPIPAGRGAGKELGIAVGDVTGHGVPAALLMTTARALIRGRVARTGSLAQVFDDINRLLSADTGGTRFMTLFYMVLDTETRAVRWISAGHDPAIIYNAKVAAAAGAGGATPAGASGGDSGGASEADAGFSELEGDDIPLGIDETWSFTEKQGRTLSPGDVIVIGTDGIWESRDASGKDFGKGRLRELVRAHAHEPAAAIAEAIARALREFRGEGRAQEDDVTLVVLKVA